MLADINRLNPRLSATIDWGGNEPVGQTFLFVARTGGPEFSVYEPIEKLGGNYTFQFDELLFSHKEGRYVGRLVIGVTTVAYIAFEYRTHAQLLEVRNANVRPRT